jgi:hypothetical protein
MVGTLDDVGRQQPQEKFIEFVELLEFIEILEFGVSVGRR